jgi:hypothetical protein
MYRGMLPDLVYAPMGRLAFVDPLMHERVEASTVVLQRDTGNLVLDRYVAQVHYTVRTDYCYTSLLS